MKTSDALVRRFWELMATNDFYSVGEVLAPEFVLDWPQSGECLRGAERFAQMNTEYESHGPWRFTIHKIVVSETEAVSDVSVTDGVQNGRALSFFTMENGKITRLVEFWPEPFPAPESRKHLIEPFEPVVPTPQTEPTPKLRIIVQTGYDEAGLVATKAGYLRLAQILLEFVASGASESSVLELFVGGDEVKIDTLMLAQTQEEVNEIAEAYLLGSPPANGKME